MSDIVLNPADSRRFLTSLRDSFHTSSRINGVLDDIGFPAGQRPAGDGTPEGTWREVLHELDAGLIQDGYRTLLEIALERYSHNPTLVELAQRYAPELVNGNGDGHAPGVGQDVDQQTSYALIRAEDEATRSSAQQFLAAQGLGPTEMWSTNHVTLFALREPDAMRVRELLGNSDGLEWTVVPPGGPTYLLSQLTVQGPDGRYFRFTDTPAQLTAADLAADTLAEYPDQGMNRSSVIDLVQANGQGVRLAPDTTLHDAHVRDGDQLRVAYGANAGAINPLYHSDGLVRAGNQIRAFIDVHPEITMWSNSPDLATTYELEFSVPSLGPPLVEGGDPQPIEDHVVQLEFGPDFPQMAPMVFWLTPIYHPNIYPNYDSEKYREKPAARGLVCLGELTDGYQPALDIGQLCQTLLDVAAFDNYGLFEFTGQLAVGADMQVREGIRGNFYDPDAALWLLTHPEFIAQKEAKKRGRRADAPEGGWARYRNVVEDYTP
jgi:hypothetical protein